MTNNLSDEQLSAMKAASANAVACLKVLDAIPPATAMAALTIALTTVVERACGPHDRCRVLGELINDTLTTWSVAAGSEGVGHTRQ